MPGVSGYEFADQLHARHPDVRLVLMSGYDKALGDGARRDATHPVVLSKPFTPATLLSTVRSALDAAQ